MTIAGVIALGRPTFDVELGTARANAARNVLDAIDVATIGTDGIVTDPDEAASAVDALIGEKLDLVVVLQATFADATTVISIAERSAVPIVVWSFPEERVGGRLRLNSLCGANLAAYSLRRRRHPCAFVHTDPGSVDAGSRLLAAIEDATSDTGVVGTRPAASAGARVGVGDVPLPEGGRLDLHAVRAAERIDERLRRSTVGVIGAPPSGFEPCRGDDEQIAAALGVRVERRSLGELFDHASAARDECVEGTVDRIRTTLTLDPVVSVAHVEPSARLYCAMRHFVDDDALAAVATRCWPECMADFGGAVCTPHAMLTEDQVPGVCEADVLGAVTALVLRLLGGSDPFIADLVDVDERDDTSVLWHCGVASTHLADPGEPPVGTVHPNRKVALVNQFALRPGRVTVARVSQCGGGLHLVVAGGEMLDRPRPYTGTCGTIRWDRPVRDIAATIFDRGVEHHLGVVYGDHLDVLVELARQWQIPVVRLGEDRAAAQASSNQSG